MPGPVVDIDLTFPLDYTRLALLIVNKSMIEGQYVISVACSQNKIQLSPYLWVWLCSCLNGCRIHRCLTDPTYLFINQDIT